MEQDIGWGRDGSNGLSEGVLEGSDEFLGDGEFLDDGDGDGEFLDDGGGYETVGGISDTVDNQYDDGEFLDDGIDYAELGKQRIESTEAMLDTESYDVYDAVESQDEDSKKIEELKEKLYAVGYEQLEDLEYPTLKELKSRVYSDVETESRELRSVVVEQNVALCGMIDTVSSQQATLVPQGNGFDEATYATFSSDTELGKQACMLLSKHINEAIRIDPDITADEIFDTYMQLCIVENRPVFNEQLILKYVETLTPIIRRDLERRVKQIRTESEVRRELAVYLNDTEMKNTSALMAAKDFAIIRQVRCYGGSRYTTVCPRCGKEIEITTPIFRFAAYATERSRSSLAFFIGNVPCECGTSLMFSMKEYHNAAVKYKRECNSSIISFLSTAKISCAGAAEMVIALPVSYMRNVAPHLFIEVTDSDTDGSARAVTKEVDSTLYNVSDDEFRDAVNKFYFLLDGKMGVSHAVLKKRIEDSVGDLGYGNVDAGRGAASADIAIDEINCDWSYHKAAVFIAQFMSLDYYVEHKRALFSLIFFIRQNPFLGDALSQQRILTLEDRIALCKSIGSEDSKGSISDTTFVELCVIFHECGLDKPLREDIKEEVKKVIPILNEKLGRQRQLCDYTLDSIRMYADEFSYTKLMKMNIIEVMDLQDFLSTRESVVILNDIADRMIIRSYAQQFFEQWKFSKIKGLHGLNSLFKVRADDDAIKNGIEKLCSDLKLSERTCMSMLPIYDRNSGAEALLSKIHKDFIRADFYRFCEDIAGIPSEYITGCRSMRMPVEILSHFSQIVNDVAKKPREYTYLTDFTVEEIQSCPECGELIFERYTPVRLDGESINEYCMRYESVMSSNDRSGTVMRDNAEKFKVFSDYFVKLSVCSALPDAELPLRGETLFAYGLLTEFCGVSKCSKSLEYLLGISPMQLNIINSMLPDYVSFVDYDRAFKLILGFYDTYIAENVDAAREKLFAATASTAMSSKEILQSADIVGQLREIVLADERLSTEEEISDANRDNSDYEMTIYFDGTIKELMRWLGVLK